MIGVRGVRGLGRCSYLIGSWKAWGNVFGTWLCVDKRVWVHEDCFLQTFVSSQSS